MWMQLDLDHELSFDFYKLELGLENIFSCYCSELLKISYFLQSVFNVRAKKKKKDPVFSQ